MQDPIRKIPRELGRIGYQFDNLLYSSLGITVARAYSRFVIEPRIRYLSGAQAQQDRVSIYLIYPAQGLLQSHFIALDHILQSGYAPIVVSNLPLSAGDTERLLRQCSTLILRPNFGYDFGGYKDALRFLGPKLNSLTKLVLFNDSNWFPIHPDHTWLAEAEAKGLDMVGSVSHGGLDTAKPFDKTTEWRIDTTRPRFHYGSFSLLLGSAILHAPGFRDFWREYRPANNKTQTILRGEIGFSQWVIDNGFTHGETLDARNLPALLNALPTERLLQIACNAVTFDRPRPNDTRRDVLLADPPDRDGLLHFILKEVFKSGQAYSLQDFDTVERTGNFIKKSPVALNRTAADQTLRILGHLDGPHIDVFRAEATEVYRRKWGNPT